MSESNHQPTLSKEQIDSVIALYSNGQYQEAIDQIRLLNEVHPNVPFLFNLIAKLKPASYGFSAGDIS